MPLAARQQLSSRSPDHSPLRAGRVTAELDPSGVFLRDVIATRDELHALLLAGVLGTSARFWMNLQISHDLAKAAEKRLKSKHSKAA